MTHPYFRAQPSPQEINSRIGGYPSWYEIDLDNVEFNLVQIKGLTDAEIIPCVKNNAYGHGQIPVVAYLEELGIERILVAKLREALEMRRNGITCDIISMDPLFSDENFEEVVEYGVTQTAYTKSVTERLSDAATRLGKTARVFVKIDTGLRRVGVRHDEAVELIEHISDLPNISMEGIFSTLTQNKAQDAEQLSKFLEVDSELRRIGLNPGVRSLASSDAVLYSPEGHLDAVRPGMILYGIYPSDSDLEAGIELRQALSFKARLEHVKWVEEGDSVTYWGRFVAPKRMRVGTLHVGFFDGIPRELANKGRIRVGERFRSILGSVSLNHVVIDLTGTEASVGDVVEVVGRAGENTVNRIASSAGWMTYSFLNHLNTMTPRVYYRGGNPVALLEPRQGHP
jgi:alanine racemase